jgi:hypothetical protein
MKLNDTGQFGQTCSIASGDVTYTKPTSTDCYVCGDYYAIRLVANDGESMYLCTQHYDERLRGDTDWWELIRLVREADGS